MPDPVYSITVEEAEKVTSILVKYAQDQLLIILLRVFRKQHINHTLLLFVFE